MTEDSGGRAPKVDLRKTQVIAAFSANIEYTRRVRPGSSIQQPTGKHGARRVTPFTDERGGEAFEVTLLSGERLTIPVSGEATTVASGSSFITASVLKELGASDITLCAPVGGGDGGRSLERSVRERGFGSLLFYGGNGTARTLTLLPDTEDARGESTLFCAKPPSYQVSADLTPRLLSLTPRLVILTGIKPSDLRLAEKLFGHHTSAKRVLLPSLGLIQSLDRRDRLKELMAQADVVQFNEQEASEFLGLRRPFTPDDIDAIASVGARTTIVTLAAKGAVMREHGHHWVEHTPTPVQTVDSSGAGDVHVASLGFYKFLHPENLPSRVCLAMACWVAGEKVRHRGPWSGIPNAEAREVALKNFIARHC